MYTLEFSKRWPYCALIKYDGELIAEIEPVESHLSDENLSQMLDRRERTCGQYASILQLVKMANLALDR